MVVDVEATVLSNVRLSDEYNVLKLEVPEIAAQTQPGQFLMVKPEMGPEPLLRRPFSIFEILHDREGNPKGISLLNKRVGIATDLLFHKQPGSHMMCLGPLGQPYKPVCPPTEAWMVAGGVGLAPFATLSYALSKQQTISTLFYGARHGGDIFCLDIFERLGIQIVLATEDGSRGEKGQITTPLENALSNSPASKDIVVYACGPTAMLKKVATLAKSYGRTCQVSVEQVMGCGLGGCYSCVIPVCTDSKSHNYVRSCIEGPVFRSEEIFWEEMDH
jgi:dihydroorotate dehydrogenase electron transfer subunit